MSKTLRQGDTGEDVKRLQQLLNRCIQPSPDLREDGMFGPKTETSVRLYQATVGLGIDGVVGPQTWSALQRGLKTNPAAAGPVPADFPNAPWVPVAVEEMGQREIPGERHNPRIIQYHGTTTLHATTDETAWCSSFVNWCMIQAGFDGTNSAAAASWLRWGSATEPVAGAVTVIFNANAAKHLSVSGNHVAFLIQETTSHFRLLGGNQSNRVRISSFPKTSWTLRGYRWPST